MHNAYDITGARVEKLRRVIKDKSLEWILIMQPENRRYYSGFSGSNGWLVISPDKAFIITDGRYYAQVEKECPYFELVKPSQKDNKNLTSVITEMMSGKIKPGRAGFEATAVTVKQYEKLKTDLRGAEFVEADEEIESVRITKDEYEISEIKRAVRIAEEGFNSMRHKIKAGVTERELAAELAYRMKLAGAEKESFDIIIASGPNGALPHANVTDREILPGDAITFDWGATVDSGYNSDMTRTYFVDTPNPEMAKIYMIVKEAQQKALNSLKPGMTTGEADKIARDIIEQAGYGEYFSHGLGHGVGLAIHEQPTLRTGIETVLEPGMVVTIEPGIYIPGKGGVRIEDMAVITKTGREVLTSIPIEDYSS